MGKEVVELIDQAILKRAGEQSPRSYLGASGLGEPCDKKLWYSYKKPKSVDDPRILRIFDLGNLIEDYMVKLLRDAGYTIHTHDEDGKQFGFIDMPIAGNSDGVLMLPDGPHLAEFKSYNTTRFSTLKKGGVHVSDPKYYTQVQIYMGEMKLDKCLFLALNKNDCEIYTEVIDYDPIEHNWSKNRGHEIAVMEAEPSRKYTHKSHFACKMCNWRKECWSE